MGNDLSTLLNVEDEENPEFQQWVSSLESTVTQMLEGSNLRQTLGIESQEIQEAVSETLGAVSMGLTSVISTMSVIDQIKEELQRSREGTEEEESTDRVLEEKTQRIQEIIERDAAGIAGFFPGSENVDTMKKFYTFFSKECRDLLRWKMEEGVDLPRIQEATVEGEPSPSEILTDSEIGNLTTIAILYAKSNFLEYKYQQTRRS